MNAEAPVAWTLTPSGDRCALVAFDPADPARANRAVRAAAALIGMRAVPGLTDIVPALTTVGIHYRPAVFAGTCGVSPYAACAQVLSEILAALRLDAAPPARLVEIPVCYGGEHGPDLEAVAQACSLSPREVVRLHSEAEVDVLMLGFAPGHPYIGRFDARLAPPRKATPRTAVAPGTIGLANRQSVIYPMTLPGGWNLIGRTPLTLFAPRRAQPCLVQAGDRVRFVPIEAGEFAALHRREEAAS
jgi:KipI family sensor histidine kinase inhibitor